MLGVTVKGRVINVGHRKHAKTDRMVSIVEAAKGLASSAHEATQNINLHRWFSQGYWSPEYIDCSEQTTIEVQARVSPSLAEFF